MKTIAYISALLATAYIGGCSESPVAPSPKLAGPASWAREKCPALPDIPELNGDPSIRRAYDLESRTHYAECSERRDALDRWAAVIIRR